MDIDGDGHRDILSGSYSRMEQEMAGLFQVLYGKADGTFRQAEVLKGTDGEPLIIPVRMKQPMTENICTRPFAVDWDADGHLDLVVGNFAGTFYWFKGEGKGQFQPKPEAIKTGDAAAAHRGRTTAIRSSSTGTATATSICSVDRATAACNGRRTVRARANCRSCSPFQTLIKRAAPSRMGSPSSEDELTGPTSSTRIWVDDVNGDGKLDLLVGDSVTLIAPAKGLSAEEFKEKFAAWQKAIAGCLEGIVFRDGRQAARTKANEEFHKLYQQRTEFMNEDRTGFVWLYLQK